MGLTPFGNFKMSDISVFVSSYYNQIKQAADRRAAASNSSEYSQDRQCLVYRERSNQSKCRRDRYLL